MYILWGFRNFTKQDFGIKYSYEYNTYSKFYKKILFKDFIRKREKKKYSSATNFVFQF